MDLAFLHFPEQFRQNDLLQLKNWTAYSVKNAAKVIAISEHTQVEVANYYQKPLADVVVAYPAAELAENVSQTRVRAFWRKHQIKQPYFLYLGTLQPRKNLIKIIEAFEIFSRSYAFQTLKPKAKHSKPNNSPSLVIVGKIGWLADAILDRAQSSTIRQKIILTDFAPEQLKKPLYEQAEASLLLSLYEGFGIPALESLLAQTIPIVADNTSLPEVVGRAGLLVKDPKSADEIAQKMLEVWQLSARKKAEFRSRARAQVKKFSWQSSAEIVLNTVEQVARQNENR